MRWANTEVQVTFFFYADGRTNEEETRKNFHNFFSVDAHDERARVSTQSSRIQRLLTSMNQEKIVFSGQAVRILFGHEFVIVASRKASLRAVMISTDRMTLMPVGHEIIAEFAIVTIMVPCRCTGAWTVHWYIVD